MTDSALFSAQYFSCRAHFSPIGKPLVERVLGQCVSRSSVGIGVTIGKSPALFPSLGGTSAFSRKGG